MKDTVFLLLVIVYSVQLVAFVRFFPKKKCVQYNKFDYLDWNEVVAQRSIPTSTKSYSQYTNTQETFPCSIWVEIAAPGLLTSHIHDDFLFYKSNFAT